MFCLYLYISNFCFSQSKANCVPNENQQDIKTCCEKTVGYFLIFKNPETGYFQAILNNKQMMGDGNLIIEDSKGIAVYSRIIKISNGINLFSISGVNLDEGVYYVKAETEFLSTESIKYTVE